jgi:magnesium chelatase family protein
MDACVKSATLSGIDGRVLEVTAAAEPGPPGFEQRGMHGQGVGQRAERVWSAVSASGLPWPRSKITVTVAPDWLPEHDTAVDLAMAVAVLAANRAVPARAAAGVMYYAGLGGDGRLTPVPGGLPAAVEAAKAGCRALVVAAENAAEARLVPGVTVIGASRLAEVAGWLCGGPTPEVAVPRPADPSTAGDMSEIRGNRTACLAAEVSAAGGHHLSLTGPPGSGMALLTGRLRGLLPLLDEAAALEVTAVHSAAGALDPAAPLVTMPPFCAPHHGSDVAELAGGAESGLFRPGAVSLAHRGVLFLDNAAEFAPEALGALREPAETGTITIPATRRATDGFAGRLPARFILITASAPCQCLALRPDPGPCACSPAARGRYAARLAGPLRDRVSLRAVMTPPQPGQAGEPGEATTVIAARVAVARERAALRLAGTPWRVNAEIPRDELLARFMPDGGGWEPIERATSLGLVSDFAAAEALRVAWTFADLNGRPRPTRGDCAAALGLRMGELR